MDGSRRTVDINLYLNNNNSISYDENHVVITNNNYITNNNSITYDENHVVVTNNNYVTNNSRSNNNSISYDENHVVITNNNYVTNNNNSAPEHHHNHQDTSLDGIPVAALDCNNNGHTFMSLLLQPSPLRTTPDMQVNIRNPRPANLHISTPGFELQYSTGGYVPPHAAGPYAGRHDQVPYVNDPRYNPMEPHYRYSQQPPPVMWPVDVDMEDVLSAPYNSASQSPEFDFVGYPQVQYPPPSHYAGNPPQLEQIVFGGRLVQAARVDLTPANPNYVVRAPHYGYGPMFYNSPQNIIGRPNSPELSHLLSHLSAAHQQHVLPSTMLPPWLTIPDHEQEASDDSDYAEDSEEENPSDLEDMFYNLQDWTYEALMVLQEAVGDVNTGLTEEQIEAVLRKYKFKQSLSDSTRDDPCCPICLDDYKEKDNLGSLSCSHDFHLECIKQWLLKKNTCPLCREIA